MSTQSKRIVRAYLLLFVLLALPGMGVAEMIT